MLPVRSVGSLTEQYGLREYLAEMAVGQNSELVGRPLMETGLEAHDVEVVGLIRDEERITGTGYTAIRAGSLLILRGPVRELLEVGRLPGLSLKAEVQLGDEDLTSDEVVLVEAVVTTCRF